MIKDYGEYTVREIFAEVGSRDEAVSIYRKANPDLSEEEIKKEFDIEEELRGRSVFDLFCMGSSMVEGYDESDAIADYLEMHPGISATDIRSDLDKAIAEDDHGVGSLPDTTRNS